MSCCDSFGYVLTVEAWLPYTSEFTNAIVPFRFASVACQASHAGQSLVRILPGEGYSLIWPI